MRLASRKRTSTAMWARIKAWFRRPATKGEWYFVAGVIVSVLLIYGFLRLIPISRLRQRRLHVPVEWFSLGPKHA